MQFSMSNRQQILTKLANETFDLLIIGGGITGVGIALDAASRGLKTALVEKNDFAFGTSSRSTKLIHGGLRYLKQFEFGLVKEVGSERAIVHKLAPHLVIPEKMLLPLSEKKGLGYWLTSIGLMIYDWLAGVKPADQRRMLTKRRTLRYEPLLKEDDIKGGAIYAEYRTDDARLTIEIAKKAAEQGATLVNYVKAFNFVYTDGKISSLNVIDELSHEAFEIRATAVVNATGPWVDELRDVDKSKIGKRLHLTKGVHIVVPREKFPVRQSIYFDVDDGRMVFAIPRGRTTYIGTTDTNYTGPIDHVFTSREDAEYLIKAVNATFPSASLKVSDIESSWAGLRPLIHEDGKTASQLSRKDEIFESPSGLVSIAGGKLTGYRKMSERVVNLVIKKHFSKRQLQRSFTKRIKLGGNAFKNSKKVDRYIDKIERQLKPYQFAEHVPAYLVHNYGIQTDAILTLMEQQDAGLPLPLRLLQAELLFSIRNEMAVTLQDFFIRRTGLIYFDIEKVLIYHHQIATLMQAELSWSDERVLEEMTALNNYIDKIKNFH